MVLYARMGLVALTLIEMLVTRQILAQFFGDAMDILLVQMLVMTKDILE